MILWEFELVNTSIQSVAIQIVNNHVPEHIDYKTLIFLHQVLIVLAILYLRNFFLVLYLSLID